MSKPVHWVIEFAIPSGKDKELRAIMNDMVEDTRADPGALCYQWNLSDDATSCHVYEHYKDSEAALAHMDTVVKKHGARFLSLATPTRFVVYGEPTEALKKALGVLNPVFLKEIGGFSR
jgi:quinol monooxygenase YgiN